MNHLTQKGNGPDNAVIEDSFELRKSELMYLREFRFMKHFKK